MITIRPAHERGHADHGWLDSRHTFSFGDYYDERHMGFRALRVINEDKVAPESGFPPHPHRDMEIVSYVVGGALEHKDSLGTGSVIRPGEIQRMSAGTGVVHSEWNHSSSEPVHFLQIWIVPERRGIAPSYEQKAIDRAGAHNALRLIGSPDGREGSVTIHQDLALYASRIDKGRRVAHELGAGRGAWVQVVRGGVKLGEASLGAGDGAAVSDERALDIEALEDAEILVFDLG